MICKLKIRLRSELQDGWNVQWLKGSKGQTHLQVVVQPVAGELVLQVDSEVHVLHWVNHDVDELHAGHLVDKQRWCRLPPEGYKVTQGEERPQVRLLWKVDVSDVIKSVWLRWLRQRCNNYLTNKNLIRNYFKKDESF